MAKLPNEIISTIFELQRQLLERIDEATATEFRLFEAYGETEEVIDYFEQFQMQENVQIPTTYVYLLL